MSDVQAYLIKNALDRIPEKLDQLQEGFEGLQERFGSSAAHEEGARDLLGFITESLRMGEEALDEAYVSFLQSCQDAGQNPNVILDQFQRELKLAVIRFYTFVEVVADRAFRGDKQSVREQKVQGVAGLLKLRLDRLIDERCAEARRGFHKGRRIWSNASDSGKPNVGWTKRLLEQISVGILITVLGGLVVWWLTAGMPVP